MQFDSRYLRIAFVSFVAVFVAVPFASASTIFSLNLDGCTGTCGSGPFASVNLTQTTATLVTVTETFSNNSERFAGTGAGEALEFNVTGPITIGGITAGFGVGSSPASASTFGSFLHAVTCLSCQGGKSSNPAGPLTFTVTSASGVTINDFITNSGGYYFASDIVGNNGNTGNVANNGITSVVNVATPEPASMLLLAAGLAGICWKKSRKA